MSIAGGKPHATLRGTTGSGKTFTLAHVIADANKPTLVISHNKTLAAQLYSEFKDLFPHNSVEYFVSYYDYYQPEAYVPSTDTYIEKDSSINDRLDRLRLSATSALLSRSDVIIVASVSCIYNLGSPQDYREMLFSVTRGQTISRDTIIQDLIDIQYERNDYDFSRGRIRVRGDCVEIFPSYDEKVLRLELNGDRVDKISIIDPVSCQEQVSLDRVSVYPAKHFLVSGDKIAASLAAIEEELNIRLAQLRDSGKLLEAQRLESRTRYDMEMLKEVGYCHGIENYSRILCGRPSGSRPYCLIDYFPGDFLTIIDESHVSLPQIRGMHAGDRARKQVLVDYGFRLPSCLDNRPLTFPEFESLQKQVIFVSATPGPYEMDKAKSNIIEQIIRPTGLVDPPIIIRPCAGQIEDLMREITIRSQRDERTLVTTLTKRMAEDLTRYLQERSIAVQYIHSEIETIDRMKLLKELRQKKYDCLIGINLLREGLDLPEVSLVAILDADKEGFLRSATSLTQVAGRCARNINGTVIMYADTVTGSMEKAMQEADRRRKIQLAFNQENGITPRTVEKAIRDGIEAWAESERFVAEASGQDLEEYERASYIAGLEHAMELSARNLQFEKAALIRDEIRELKKTLTHGTTADRTKKV